MRGIKISGTDRSRFSARVITAYGTLWPQQTENFIPFYPDLYDGLPKYHK